MAVGGLFGLVWLFASDKTILFWLTLALPHCLTQSSALP